MTDQNTNQQNTNSQQPTGVLSELVGEGKKFVDAEALAKGKKEADAFVDHLKGENATLRDLVTELAAKADRASGLEGILQRVKNGNANDGGGNPAPNQQNTQQANQPDTGKIVEDVIKLLEEKDRTTKGMANIAVVDAALSQAFGNSATAKEAVKVKAAELGLSVEEIYKIGAQSPNALYQMLGVQHGTSGNGGNANLIAGQGTNTSYNQSNSTGQRNAAYYEKLKNEMGVRKFVMDRRLQIQLHKDMQTLGDRWES